MGGQKRQGVVLTDPSSARIGKASASLQLKAFDAIGLVLENLGDDLPHVFVRDPPATTGRSIAGLLR
jgi:hypothetical protein